MVVQVYLLHNSASADQCIPVAELDGTASAVVLDSDAVVVVEDTGIQHYFVYTIPSWHFYSYTSE